MADLLDRITINPHQCGGRPCIRGMRIRVTDILDLLVDGAWSPALGSFEDQVLNGVGVADGRVVLQEPARADPDLKGDQVDAVRLLDDQPQPAGKDSLVDRLRVKGPGGRGGGGDQDEGEKEKEVPGAHDLPLGHGERPGAAPRTMMASFSGGGR